MKNGAMIVGMFEMIFYGLLPQSILVDGEVRSLYLDYVMEQAWKSSKLSKPVVPASLTNDLERDCLVSQ